MSSSLVDVVKQQVQCWLWIREPDGLEALKEHFRNSKFACDNDEYMPVVFSPPRDGRRLTEPVPVVVGREQRMVDLARAQSGCTSLTDETASQQAADSGGASSTTTSTHAPSDNPDGGDDDDDSNDDEEDGLGMGGDDGSGGDETGLHLSQSLSISSQLAYVIFLFSTCLSVFACPCHRYPLTMPLFYAHQRRKRRGGRPSAGTPQGRTLVAPTPVCYKRERRRHSRGGALTGYCSRRETIHRVLSVVGFAPPLCARIKEVDPPDAPTRTGQRVGPWNSEILQTHADNNAVTHIDHGTLHLWSSCSSSSSSCCASTCAPKKN
ncbi:hypothetical protein B296_00048576 [Ensete ventricosum]|uniref:Uncharacterized protein n=1 Tax=Ensete ventricosum TaxID=4639 RepID=A0A426YU44_ENSVE|nr:hypothetical protein B296_00048576 [Ensete ventricosum]